MTAIVAEITVADMTNAAMDNAQTYIAATQAKNRAKNPPAAAKDTIRDTTMTLKVATKKKSMKMSNPVSERKMIPPTYGSE